MIFWQSVADGILNGAIYALISLGLTLIFGVMRIINMAHGEFMMLGMYAAYFLYTMAGVDPFVGLPVAAALVFGLGVVLYRLGVARVSRGSEENTLLFTAGASLFLANLAQLVWSPNYLRLDLPYSTKVVHIGAISLGVTKLISFCITLLCILGLWYFLTKTILGSSIRAAAQNREAALAVGVDVDRVAWITFGLGAAFAAIAGSMLTTTISIYPTIGTIFIVKAFIVVVLGGMGSIPGAALGGIMLGLFEDLGSVFLSSNYKDAYGLVIFLLILLLRPWGLLGKQH